MLPFEIGKLFHLHSLGLHGNPLNKDVMSLYSESNGTLKLVSYMLDNLSGEWRQFSQNKSAESSHIDRSTRNSFTCVAPDGVG